MKITKILLIQILALLILLVCSCTKEQLHSNQIVKIFQRVMGQQDRILGLEVNDVIASNEQGYIVAGRREFPNAVIGDAKTFGFWIKLNGDGIVEEEINLGFFHGISVETDIKEIAAVTEVGYALSGFTKGFQTEKHFLSVDMIDELGGFVWNYTSTVESEGLCILKEQDNSLIVGGFKGKQFRGNGYLVKLNSEGLPEWEKDFEAGEISSIRRHPDGNFAVFLNENGVYKIIKMDTMGAILSEVNLGTLFSTDGLFFEVAQNGDYFLGTIFATSLDVRSSLMRVDDAGNAIWEVTLLNKRIRDIAPTRDDGVVITGNTSGTGWADAFLVRLDAVGLEIWDRRYGEDLYEATYAVTQADDGGYFLGGIDFSQSTQDNLPGDQGIYILKTGRDGLLE